MRLILFSPAVLLYLLVTGLSAEPEYITVPVEATAKITGENYHKARTDAITQAFRSAVFLAVSGIVSVDEIEYSSDLIDKRLVAHGEDFVSSYKFLEETANHTEETLTVRLQVTLFLDTIRGILSEGGVRAKKRKLPKLLILVQERNASFLSEGNFLLLTSMTEEILARNFRQRGFLVADRKEVRKLGLDAMALAAINGDASVAAQLGQSLEADMLILGNTDVSVTPEAEAERIDVTIKMGLRAMPGGELILEESQTGEGLYTNVLSGSLETIEAAANVIARNLAVAVQGKWLDFMEGSNG